MAERTWPWGEFPEHDGLSIAEITRRAILPSVFVQLYATHPLLSLMAAKPEMPAAWAAAPPIALADLPITVSRSAIKSVLLNG